jgi:SET domain-containing protein
MKTISHYKDYSDQITFKIEAEEEEYLYIRKSRIPNAGYGLFTSIPIYKDEIISIFTGELLSEKEAKSRSGKMKNRYFINMPDRKTLDCMRVKCFAKYANDACGIVKTRYRNNSKIKIDDNGQVCLVANRNILAGEEIFCSYGKGYWKNYLKKKG